jgi:hypothetical protein
VRNVTGMSELQCFVLHAFGKKKINRSKIPSIMGTFEFVSQRLIRIVYVVWSVEEVAFACPFELVRLWNTSLPCL